MEKTQNVNKLLVFAGILLASLTLAVLTMQYGAETIPISWGIDGAVKNASNTSHVVIVFPVLILVLSVLFYFLTASFQKQEQLIRYVLPIFFLFRAIILMLTGIQATFLFIALEWTSEPYQILSWTIGIAYLLIGNVLPRFNASFSRYADTGVSQTKTMNARTIMLRMGYAFLFIGLILIANGFLPSSSRSYVFFVILIVGAIVQGGIAMMAKGGNKER
ncbi:hypothetical protein EBB07_24795 [Paenibacillaceae bacterium]|nr:hypothetical protein EBB07_24795 [Paenibacillaceae bacterium]